MGQGILGLVTVAASTGLSLYSQAQQKKTVTQTAKYNARLAEAEALNIEGESRQAIMRQRAVDRENLASIRTQLGGSGDRGNAGTNLILAGEAAGRMELGIADAARTSAMAASRERQKGRMGLWEAEQSNRATTLNMIGTGLQGLTSAFGQYQQGKDVGIYPRFKKGS